MAEGHIYINGAIGTYRDPAGVSLLKVVSDIKRNKDASELFVHINSPGGECDLGYAIYNLLRGEQKKITTVNEGLCASIATIILLAGDERLGTPGCETMIHNPWMEIQGDAEQLERASLEIREEENKAISFYSKHTGLSKDTLDSLMKVETFMNLEQAIDLGFLTGTMQRAKAVASLKPIKEEKMDKSLVDKIESGFNKIFDLLKAKKYAYDITSGSGEIYTLTHADGSEGGEVLEGDTILKSDGTPASGEIVMPNGDTIVAVDGKVTQVIKAAATDPVEPDAVVVDEEKQLLVSEVEKLKEENAALAMSVKGYEDKIKSYDQRLLVVEAGLRNAKGSYTPPVHEEAFQEKEKNKEPFNAVKAAMEERKQRKLNK